MSVPDARRGAGGVPADLPAARPLEGTLILHAFLHFEATSLGRHGFPIEVAWVFENGDEESHLIRPAPGWTDWDPDPKTPNAISRDRLGIEGAPVETIAHRLVDQLGNGAV